MGQSEALAGEAGRAESPNQRIVRITKAINALRSRQDVLLTSEYDIVEQYCIIGHILLVPCGY